MPLQFAHRPASVVCRRPASTDVARTEIDAPATRRRPRLAIYLLVIVALTGGLACLVKGPKPAPGAEVMGPWRRTASGWRRGHCWTAPQPFDPPALHPAVVGAGQLLASLVALLACAGANASRPRLPGAGD